MSKFRDHKHVFKPCITLNKTWTVTLHVEPACCKLDVNHALSSIAKFMWPLYLLHFIQIKHNNDCILFLLKGIKSVRGATLVLIKLETTRGLTLLHQLVKLTVLNKWPHLETGVSSTQFGLPLHHTSRCSTISFGRNSAIGWT